MSDKQSAGIEPLVSRNAHFEAVSKALSVFVGRGCRHSYKDVQRGAGIPERMIECYRHHPNHSDWRPIKPEELASLYRFLGPEFTSTYLTEVAEQSAYWNPEGSGDAHVLNTDCAEFNFEHAKATSPDSPGGPEIVPEEKHRLRLIAARMEPHVHTVAKLRAVAG
jgi:hypothetical protein